MATGLFPTRQGKGGPRKGYIPINRRVQPKRDLSAFTDALADGSSIAAAGRVIGVSRTQAHQHFLRICKELGEQAV